MRVQRSRKVSQIQLYLETEVHAPYPPLVAAIYEGI